MQPAVRDLNALVNEIGVAYQPQYQTIDRDVQFNEQSGQAATAGLQAQQRQAFGGIEQAAQNKGMFFSGFSPSEQANYTATTYLPKLAELNQTIAQTRNALLGRKAELDTDIRNKAFATRESDLGALRTWEQQQAQRAWEAEQNRLKMEQERQLQAQQIAAQRASARGGGGGTSSKNAALVGTLGNYLATKSGKDGFAHPVAFQNARTQWVQAGGDPSTFNATFAARVNPKHPESYGFY